VDSVTELDLARDALARGAWEEARAAFERELEREESAEALEGLGLTSWWLDRGDRIFETRERSYTLYRERGERASAARLAVWLAWDYAAFRGELAVANGWLRRARRLLDGLPSSPEHAFLALREGVFALLEEGDPGRALEHADSAIAVAHAIGSTDLEMVGRALAGFARVTAGKVSEGLRELDEVNAAIVAGELKDAVAIGLASCYLIAACERIRDYDRAVEWCHRLKAFCAKVGLRPLFAVCRTQYASVCIWRGTWTEADRELTLATEELAAARPAMTAEGLVRLAELRRRQGRLDEASAMFERAEPHPQASLGLGHLAVDRGDARMGADFAERYLRRFPAGNRIERASGLELLVRAELLLGRRREASAALQELESIAAEVGTTPLVGSARLSAGLHAAAAGDADGARRHFEDAVDRFQQSGAPFETARARIELARALGTLGRLDESRAEADRAIALLSGMSADFEISRARAAVPDSSGAAAAPGRPAVLSRREIEVLRHVAQGLSNQTIGERLFISEHTVHRHVANILTKFGVPSRAAAVAQAARDNLL
jgi:LuxR family maltose regulon positive regulatory protein